MKRTTLIAWFAFALIVLISVWAALLDAAATRQGSVPRPGSLIWWGQCLLWWGR